MRLNPWPRAWTERWRAMRTRQWRRRLDRRDARTARRVERGSSATASSRTLVLLTLTTGWEPAVGRAIAANPSTPVWCLRRLAFRQWDVAAEVAKNPRTPDSVLARLAVTSPTSQWAVRAAVATQPRTPPEVLSRMALYSAPRLKIFVAANPNLPTKEVDRLLTDDDAYVRGVAAGNPSASPEALARLAQPMADRPWVLRAAAANPSCPQDVAEQVLTWLALGGAGNGDPRFDPISCDGHPGDTSMPIFTWYREAARRANPDEHPLWRVRAVITMSLERIPTPMLGRLADDPRPEVRRSAARFKELSWGRLRDLRQDVDPGVRQVADRAMQNKRTNPTPTARRRRTVRWVRAVLIAGVITSTLHYIPGGGGSGPAVSPSTPSFLNGGDSIGGLPSGAETPTDHATLPGAGSLVAGHVVGVDLDYLTVTSTSVGLDIAVPTVLVTDAGDPVDGDLVVDAGSTRTVIFSAPADSSLTITVRPVGAKGPMSKLLVHFGSNR